MDERYEADMVMYMESMVQWYHKYTIHSLRALVLKAPSFSFKTFAVAVAGFNGGTDLGRLGRVIVHWSTVDFTDTHLQYF